MDCVPSLATILLQNIQAGIILIDASNKLIVDANPMACVLLGASKEEIVGSYCFDWFCPDGNRCPLLSVDENGVPIEDIDNEETQIKRPDGSYVFLLRTAVSVLLKDRRHIIVTLMDITRQKETEKNYSDLFKYAPAGIYELDFRTQKFISVNDLMLQYTGYSRQEFLNLSPFDLLDDEGKSVFLDRLRRMSQGEEVPPEVEYKVITKSGDYYWISLHTRYVKDERGIPVSAFCIATDITAKKVARMELVESHNQAQMYLDMSFSMFVSLDTEGKIKLINRTGCDILGIDECFLMGQYWFDFIPEEDKPKTKELFNKLVSGEYDGNVTEFENRVLNSKGEKRLIAWKNRVVRDAQNKIIGTFSSGDDITVQREAEKKIEAMWNKVDAELTEKLDELKAVPPPFPFSIKRFALMESLDSLIKGRI